MCGLLKKKKRKKEQEKNRLKSLHPRQKGTKKT